MLGDFRWLGALGIVFGLHIIPGKFAETGKPEPGTEHGKIM